MSSAYEITGTTKSIYNDPDKGIVNGVKVSFKMLAYDERGEVNIPVMSAQAAKEAIEKYVSERDQLAPKK